LIDRIDTHPTPPNKIYIEERSGKDRRKIHTMLDPAIDRRKGDRRKRSPGKRPRKVNRGSY
jgi:hypothetical protein